MPLHREQTLYAFPISVLFGASSIRGFEASADRIAASALEVHHAGADEGDGTVEQLAAALRTA